MTGEGEFVIGGILPGMEDKLAELKGMLETVMPTRVSPEIESELYSKMVVNSCITSLGVISGLRLGDMLKKRKARELFLGIVREAVAAAEAMNMKIPPYGGKLDYYALARNKNWLDRAKGHIIIRIVGFKYRRLKSSSLQSLQRGKPTEIDYFNGYIAKKGADLGVPTPVNDAVVKMVKEIEAGKRKSEPANFLEL
jgi:2-dehydropantoate 2-reductase